MDKSIPGDNSILRIRQLLLVRLERLVLAWALVHGLRVQSLRSWVDGVLGEAIAIAFAQQDKWNPEKGDFLHWVFLKAKNLLRKELRSESRYQRSQQRLIALASHQGRSRQSVEAFHDDLLEVLEKLPLEHQQALVLYYFHGMTVPRIAEVLGKNDTAAQGLLERARKKAQKLWNGLGQQAPPVKPGSESVKRRPSRRLNLSLEDRRKELELRRFVDRLFRLTDPPGPSDT